MSNNERMEEFAQQIAEGRAKLEEKYKTQEAASEAVSEEAVAQDATIEAHVASSEDPYLAEAVKMGYDPDYKGGNKKSPEQFVKDGSFFRKIDTLKQKLDMFGNVIQDLTAANQKVAEENYKKGIEDALKKRAEAVATADVDAFNKAEQELLKAQQSAPKQPSQASEAEKQWLDENKDWFNSSTEENKEMAALAIGYGQWLEKTKPNITQKEILQKMSTTIKSHPDYAHRFQTTTNKETAPAVGKSTTVSSGKSSSNLISRLTTQQKAMYENTKHMHSKGFTLESYAKALASAGKLN